MIKNGGKTRQPNRKLINHFRLDLLI